MITLRPRIKAGTTKARLAVQRDLAARDCVLTIETGLQAGAWLVLPTGLHRVGGELGNDVVVSEAALAACHFEIEHDGAVTLRACSAALRFADTAGGPAGRSIPVEGSLRFQVGRTEFRLDAPALPLPPAAARRPAAPLGTLCAYVAVVLVVFAQGTECSEAVGRPAPGSLHAAASVAPAPGMAEIVAAVSERLAAGGLSRLQPAAGADGTVAVSGTLSPAQKAGWAEVKRWFDSTYGARLMLVDRVVVIASKAPLSIAAVRPGGDAPFVIDQSGRRLFVGSEIGDGWVVAAIEPTRVTVRRSAETLAVRF